MSQNQNNEEISFFQRLYDNWFVLLILGTVVMFGVYTIWGVIEIMIIPQATLP